MTPRSVLGRVTVFNVLIALVGVLLLCLSIPNAGPVLRAARAGDGVQGVFIAQRLSCVRHPGHTACDWTGEFRSATGALIRRDVVLYGGAGRLTTGSHTYARDVGRSGRVYRHPGSHEWILTALLALAGLLLLGWAGHASGTRPARPPARAVRSDEPVAGEHAAAP